MHKRVREREEGRKETEKQERRNERQKIGMKNCEEQLKEEKKHPHGSSGMSDRASSGKWELVLNKQTYKQTKNILKHKFLPEQLPSLLQSPRLRG